jgi:amino acid transporter
LTVSAVPPPTTPPQAGSSPGWLDELQGVFGALRMAWAERVELLSLELASAVRAAAQILILVVAAAIVAVTAWLGLWGVAAGVLINLGLPWALALLIVVAINLVAAWLALARARALLSRLSLPATRRHLSLRPTAPAPAPAPAPANAAAAPLGAAAVPPEP